MLVFVIRRVLISIPVLIASTILTFVIVKFSGDPLAVPEGSPPTAAQAFIDGEAHRLWLDRSWPAQYWHWISNIVVALELGPAGPGPRQRPQRGVHRALGHGAPGLLSSSRSRCSLAVVTGVISAVKQYSVTDYTTTFLGFIFLSMPTFWFALLLKQGGVWFNGKVGSRVFLTLGEPDSWTSPQERWSRSCCCRRSRSGSSATRRGAGSPAPRCSRCSTATTCGWPGRRDCSPRTVLIRHALRTALIPLATVTALDVAALLGGAIITENVFQWHGMGNLFVNALTQHRLQRDAGLAAGDRGHRHRVQPDRRHPVRRSGPEDPPCLRSTRSPATSRPQPTAPARRRAGSASSRVKERSQWQMAVAALPQAPAGDGQPRGLHPAGAVRVRRPVCSGSTRT